MHHRPSGTSSQAARRRVAEGIPAVLSSRAMKTSHEVRALGARPLIAVAALIVVVTLGNALLVGCGGKSNQSGGEGTQAQSAAPAPSTEAAGGATATGNDGAKIYAQFCTPCHGPNGKGDGPAGQALNPHPRDHTDGTYMNARTDDQLLGVIRDGKGQMPSWKNSLTEEQIEAVLKHVRSLAVPPYKG
jgi:mono/diheme cytochrome c family protein